MTLLLFILAAALLIAFIGTWVCVGSKADDGQYGATCSKVQDLMSAVDALKKQHNGYGPTGQHMPALDQVVTLQLHPDQQDRFFIPSPDLYKVGYATREGTQSTERSVTLRELLNRLLKDAPIELVHPVNADWSFKPKPTEPPLSSTKYDFPLFNDHN